MHNWAEGVRDNWRLPRKVSIHDVTLRDGEQSPGVVFRLNEKLKIAHALADAGIQRIEAGMPAVSAEDAEAITRIAKEIKEFRESFQNVYYAFESKTKAYEYIKIA